MFYTCSSFQMINIIDHLVSKQLHRFVYYLPHLGPNLLHHLHQQVLNVKPSYLGVSPGLAVRVGPVPGRFPLSGPLHDYRWRLRDDGRITLVGDDHGLVGSCAL